MRPRHLLMVDAVLLAFAQIPLKVAAQATKVVIATPAPFASPTSTNEDLPRSATDWIQHKDSTDPPVPDDINNRLTAARAALEKKGNANASEFMRDTARLLDAQGDHAATLHGAPAASDMKADWDGRDCATGAQLGSGLRFTPGVFTPQCLRVFGHAPQEATSPTAALFVHLREGYRATGCTRCRRRCPANLRRMESPGLHHDVS